MPKKMGVNSKAEEARERRAAAESDRRERDAKQREDAYWREAEGPKSKAAQKREADAEKRAETAARRAEARRLAELEQSQLSQPKPNPKAARVSAPKVTGAELARQREEEAARLAREAEAAKKRQARVTEAEEYEKEVLVENTNRAEDLIEARSVDEAIAKMSIVEASSSSGLPADRHPEKRLKASYKAFEEAELPKLKEEKPGLTLNQYKDMIWKLWKKSPDNPLNQVAE